MSDRKTYITLSPQDTHAIAASVYNGECHKLFNDDFFRAARQVLIIADVIRLKTEEAKRQRFSTMDPEQKEKYAEPTPLTQVEYFLKSMQGILDKMSHHRALEDAGITAEPQTKKAK